MGRGLAASIATGQLSRIDCHSERVCEVNRIAGCIATGQLTCLDAVTDQVQTNIKRQIVSTCTQAGAKTVKEVHPGTVASYEEVPYASYPFAQAHPDRLKTVARLFGMSSPPLEFARVLEIGCASGGHLIPFALAFPGSVCVGIDGSARQIAEGQKVVQKLGLQNIKLRAMNILEITPELGTYDYIIAHGVFSWVPIEVQEKILMICKEQLSPNGVAYISYNTYPGWHMRGMIRDMMRYHTERFNGPVVKVRQARALLDFLQQSVRDEKSAYTILLRQEVETIRRQADHYLYHEHLEEVNDPTYFYQFVERAEKHGLQFLAEARVGTMYTANFGPDVEKTLRILATDLVQMEQYMDFLRNRMFRETLLCHKDRLLERMIAPQSIFDMYVSSIARTDPNQPVDILAQTPASYFSPSGMSMTTSQPLMKAAMQLLQERWPGYVHFEELRKQARVRLKQGDPNDATLTQQDRQLIAVGLLNCYLGSDLVDLRTTCPELVTTVSDKPVVCPLARVMHSFGVNVPNRRHEVVNLNDLQKHMLPMLDGEHDRVAVEAAMLDLARREVITLQENGETIRDPERMKVAIAALVEASLVHLAKNALLVA